MDISPSLRDLGLNASDVRVYLHLLDHGMSTPPQIAKSTGIQRTHCYNILRELGRRGLVDEQRGKGKRMLYLARDPASLFTSVEHQREIIERILPDLRARYTLHEHKPKIQFFEGRSQIQEVYRQSLLAKEIFGIGSTHQMQQGMPEFYEWYQKEIKKRQIVYHDILTHASGHKTAPTIKALLKGLYDLKLLSLREGDAPMDILVWDDHVGLISHEEPIYGTVITNTAVAKMMRLIFNALWVRME